MCLNALNLMCREILAIGDTHPRTFRSPCYIIQVSFSGFVLQDTGFPVLEGRASETRPPGNWGRLCRGTQVSQGRPLFWGTTAVLRGRVNYSSICLTKPQLVNILLPQKLRLGERYAKFATIGSLNYKICESERF